MAEGRVFTRKGIVETGKDNVWFYHANDDNAPLLHKLIVQQHVESFADDIPDVLKGRISGGWMQCRGFAYRGKAPWQYARTDCLSYEYAGESLQSGQIRVFLRAAQDGDAEIWKNRVLQQAEQAQTHENVRSRWKEYFEKSCIRIDERYPDSPRFRIGRNHQLFRYMLGCNAYGEWPTKFNGGLFTFDEDFTPDFRKWSGIGFTAQNQRLVY